MEKEVIIKRLIIIIIIFCVIVSAFYFILNNLSFRSNKSNVKVELISDGCEEITVNDNFPMTDDVGRTFTSNKESRVQAFCKFEVKTNKSTKYSLYLSDADYDNSIHSNFIKVYLTDELENPVKGFDTMSVPTFYSLRSSSINPTDRVLLEDKLKAKDSKKYILRVWVGDAYAVGTNVNKFSMKLHVEAN